MFIIFKIHIGTLRRKVFKKMVYVIYKYTCIIWYKYAHENQEMCNF